MPSPSTNPNKKPPLHETLTPSQSAMVAVAAADLAKRRDIDVSSVVVLTVEEVTWPDRSLGCPMKGMQYLQVVTPGIRIVLEADGVSAEYHAGPNRPPFFCADPQTPIAD